MLNWLYTLFRISPFEIKLHFPVRVQNCWEKYSYDTKRSSKSSRSYVQIPMNYIYIIKSKVKFNQGSSARFLPDRRFPTTTSIERLIKTWQKIIPLVISKLMKSWALLFLTNYCRPSRNKICSFTSLTFCQQLSFILAHRFFSTFLHNTGMAIKSKMPKLIKCDALRDLVSFVQFKNREKTHGGVLNLSLQLY